MSKTKRETLTLTFALGDVPVLRMLLRDYIAEDGCSEQARDGVDLARRMLDALPPEEGIERSGTTHEVFSHRSVEPEEPQDTPGDPLRYCSRCGASLRGNWGGWAGNSPAKLLCHECFKTERPG